MVAFGIGGESSFCYRISITINSFSQQGAAIAEAANKFRGRRKCQLKDIVKDENLSIAVGPCADANRWNLCGRSDLLGQLPRNPLKDEGDCAGAFQRCSVRQEFLHLRNGAALNVITAHAEYRLRRQSDVTNDRNLC